MTTPSARGRWSIEDGVRVKIDGAFYLTFQRSRRLEAHDASVAPPSYGVAPVTQAGEPDGADILIPVLDDEAVWLGLSAVEDTSPCAVRVIVREPVVIDAVTGAAPIDNLISDPQNYVVVPPQFAVAGVTAGAGIARQFVRVPRSEKEAPCHRLEVVVHAPAHAVSPEAPSATSPLLHHPEQREGVNVRESKGFVIQRIVRDPDGVNAWSPAATASLQVAFVMPEIYSQRTGKPRPRTARRSNEVPGVAPALSRASVSS